MDMVLLGTALICIAFVFCGYLLGYSRSENNVAETLHLALSKLIHDGVIDEDRIKAYYKKKYNVDFKVKRNVR